MNENLTPMAEKQWSGLVLSQYYTNVQKALEVAPLHISNDMAFNVLDDTEDSSDEVRTEAGLTAPGTVISTELKGKLVELRYRTIHEYIPITNAIIAGKMNFKLIESKMNKCAYKLAKDVIKDINTQLINANNYLPSMEIDLSGGGRVKWNVPATCVPRKDIQDLYSAFIKGSEVDLGDPRITLYINANLYSLVLASQDYKDWKVKAFGFTSQSEEEKMKAYFEVPNVKILPSKFSDVAVILMYEPPQAGISVSNINTNQSSLITSAFNLEDVNQPLEYQLANGTRFTESRAFIGARYYLPESGDFYDAHAFTWNKVHVHNPKTWARLKNIV